jgi:hypothetical protein
MDWLTAFVSRNCWLAHRIHRTRLEWFDLQLGRADPLRFFHRGEV